MECNSLQKNSLEVISLIVHTKVQLKLETAGQSDIGAVNQVPSGISASPDSLLEGPKLNWNQQIC